MANTVITNYTDLNGPSSKSDSSVVVIVNKDGSLSVDQNLLGTLMGTDGSQSAGISVVRVGHEGRPDDATDSENEDDKIPHVTLSVDSYYDEPNSIIKYDSGAEMLQSLRIETRENSLVGFQNDHCYTSLTSPSQLLPQGNETFIGFEDPVIEITHTPPPKPVQSNKKITILEQQIIPKGKKIIINPAEASVILKGNDLLHKPLPVFTKSKQLEAETKAEVEKKDDDNTDSSSVSSSSESAPDRDSDSDYKDTKDRSLSMKLKKPKIKPRILKTAMSLKETKLDVKTPKPKANRSIVRRDIREKIQQKNAMFEKKEIESPMTPNKESLLSSVTSGPFSDQSKVVSKQVQKVVKKEKKTPAHVTALLSDMTSLFSSPDVIRRVSTDTKIVAKPETSVPMNKKSNMSLKSPEIHDAKGVEPKNDISDKLKPPAVQKTYLKQSNKLPTDKPGKGFEAIPQLDDMSLAQILQDTTTPMKIQPNIPSNASPGLTGPLLPSLDLSDLQPIEEGLPEDVLMHVAQLVESSENLQEVIDKQVLGKVDTLSKMQPLVPSTLPQHSPASIASLQMSKTIKTMVPKKDPIEIVRRDGRVITLPPIEAPATRASKRKSQVDSTGSNMGTPVAAAPLSPVIQTPEPVLQHVSKQYVNRKLSARKQETVPPIEEPSAESQESLNSEDDPNRLWCICKQPHNNRFMICCDSCQDWFHGKCVNITKAMGQQMEDQGIEWRCPNCVKSIKTKTNKAAAAAKNIESHDTRSLVSSILPKDTGSKTNCIVCKKSARASSIYCSDACILKHAQDSLGTQGQSKTDEIGPEKLKAESRVIVYERKSGRLLAGPNAPTAENLKLWLQKNPTFEVVRPGTLSTIKPNPSRKKSAGETNKIQTTLNFEKLPKKQSEILKQGPHDYKEKISIKPVTPKEEAKPLQTKFLATPKPITPPQIFDTPKSHHTAPATRTTEARKPVRTSNRSQSSQEKTPSVTPPTPRRKDVPEPKMKLTSAEPIRDNVKKALQEQMSIRMAETKGSKFTEDEILQFAIDTEFELHELFRDVGMKYKAKYRSLMFNIKDRKNLSLWQKICDRTITPEQLVRLSPEELASQELAQWRDKEVKHSLELIKKSELDLLAANKTYVLKTHKGEEVMETKESVSTELDPNVPVEDVVSALNDSMGNEPAAQDAKDTPKKSESVGHKSAKKYGSSKKKDKENGLTSHSKSKRESKKDLDSRKSRSSRRKSTRKEKEERRRRSDRKSRSLSQSRSRTDSSKEKADETSKYRSRSRLKSKRRSKDSVRSTSRERDRSRSSGRSRRRSRSRDSSRRRSRSKHRQSTEDKVKHRSKSQENTYKTKNDSTDSDSIERPKSAMLKETHPEYDPHEPMITSAFSEEDLRKSREDVYDDYKNEITNYSEVDYDPSKSFSINTSVMPTDTYLPKQDKAPEVESDQEPSSTVESSAPIVWNGCINMVDVARFYVAAHEVSGNAMDLEEDLSAELDVVGRINPDTVWDYILKMKRAGNKDIVILRLQAANDEEKMQYIALYSYLSSRNRLGVVKVANTATVKDLYVVPLAARAALPAVLLPLEGAPLDVKTHLLIAIVIRQRKKRVHPNLPKEIISAKVIGESRKRSYTPPVGGRGFTPPSSPKRRALPLPSYASPTLSTSVKDKIAATLACADDEEAYSPGSSTSSGSAPAAPPAPAAAALRNKMEELNRQIEEQKQQILKMAQADSSILDPSEEAYSPSRPMTPPDAEGVCGGGGAGAAGAVPLADIALPSNLQEILASIKQRTPAPVPAPVPAPADIDMRQLPPA